MKYLQVYVLFVVFVFHTSCGESQTNVPPDNIKPNGAGYSEAQLQEADTSRVPMSMVRHVRQARNGDILIASYLGVFRYDGTSFTNLTSKIISPRFASFWDVLEDRKGNLWFGTKDSGVYYDDGKSVQHFTTREGLANNRVVVIYEDSAGNIWFGTGGGVSRYDGKSFQNFTTKEGLSNNDLTNIMEDKTGRIWFGTRGDACYYDGKTFTVLRNKNGEAYFNVWGLAEDRNGNIWLGGSILKDRKGSTLFLETGLWRYDGSTITKVSEKGASAIIEDKNGNLWTTGANGPAQIGQAWALFRYDQKSLYDKIPAVTEIKSEKGMLLGILEDTKGNIWFGAGGGVYRYDGKTITDFKNSEGQK